MNRKVYLKFLFVFFLPLVAGKIYAQQSLFYDFRNTLNEKNGSGPALNVLGTGAFINESLPDLSCLTRPTYGFTQNSGIQFDNTQAGNFIGTSYTIEMYFKFTNNSGFMRILDYKNRTSDFGLYATSGILQFYDELTVGTSAFQADQYVHLVITRDNAEEVGMYIDGVLYGSFTDNNGSALPDGSNVLNFFQDDLVFGGEANPGNIAVLKIYDFALSETEVADSYLALKATSGVLAFSSDISSSCLLGNVFNFTNESDNTSAPTYTWDFGDGNSFVGTDATYSYSGDGIFTVTLIADDGMGCVDAVDMDVEVLPAPVVDLGLDLTVCDGELALLDAGPGFVSYLWNDGSTDETFIVSQPGDYSVQVTDAMGCLGADTIHIDYISAPVFSLGADTTLCFGAQLTLEAPPGMDSYFWSTGQTDESIIVGTSGIYAVEVTSVEGCMAVDTIEVTVNPPLAVSLGNDVTVCEGQPVTLDPGPGYESYLWSDGSTDPTLIVTSTDVYAVTVSDQFGCTNSASVVVTVNPTPVVNLGLDGSICGGTTVTLDAGPGFVSYLWNDNSTDQTLDVSTAGIYQVTVTDDNGCEGADDIVISVDPPVNLGPDQFVCEGSLVVLDPLMSYTTYLWSDGSNTTTLDVTTSGVYTLTVTDINGCINSDEVSVTFIPLPFVDLGADIDICDGNSTVLDAGSGFASYLWSDGSGSSTLSVSNSGSYTVTVTDITGCSASDDITVMVNPVPFVELGPDQNICEGTATVLDAGSDGISYEWSDGSNSQLLLVFDAGTYTVTVTNSFGCEAMDMVTIGVLSAPVVDLGADTTLCDGATILLDAGSGFTSYLWSDGSSSQTLLVSMAAGMYTVTVTDGNGCAGTDNVEVSYYLPLPPLELGPNQGFCQGGSVVLDAGSGADNYLWSDGSSSQQLTVTMAGTYTVTISNMAGCSVSDNITISEFSNPVVSLGADSTLCFGTDITLDAGSGFNSYLWSGGLGTNQTVLVNAAGTYTVTVTDLNGCSGSDAIVIGYYPQVPTPVITQNGNTLESSSATGNQWYSNPGGLIPGATGNTYDPPADGMYYVVVTDVNGCESAPSATINFVLDGIETVNGVSYTIWPNPASEMLFIRINDPALTGFDLALTDVAGKCVYKKLNITENGTTLDVSGFNSGVYFISLTLNHQTSVKKLVITRK